MQQEKHISYQKLKKNLELSVKDNSNFWPESDTSSHTKHRIFTQQSDWNVNTFLKME